MLLPYATAFIMGAEIPKAIPAPTLDIWWATRKYLSSKRLRD